MVRGQPFRYGRPSALTRASTQILPPLLLVPALTSTTITITPSTAINKPLPPPPASTSAPRPCPRPCTRPHPCDEGASPGTRARALDRWQPFPGPGMFELRAAGAVVA
ncbi:hypothetical protein D9615_009832 [Tricholomella constricta]|uniref:Uncharacterized protein n=1 Tax=Tricholomella constricta TaxID=117010 RepID=A0A8H5LX79_9AGAR|nr:hypothetical protein D9615_009832 [Tricholomella constricta]